VWKIKNFSIFLTGSKKNGGEKYPPMMIESIHTLVTSSIMLVVP